MSLNLKIISANLTLKSIGLSGIKFNYRVDINITTMDR